MAAAGMHGRRLRVSQPPSWLPGVFLASPWRAQRGPESAAVDEGQQERKGIIAGQAEQEELGFPGDFCCPGSPEGGHPVKAGLCQGQEA